MAVEAIQEQAFLEDYKALCNKYGLQLAAVPQIRMLNEFEFMGATTLKVISVEGWQTPQEGEKVPSDSTKKKLP